MLILCHIATHTEMLYTLHPTSHARTAVTLLKYQRYLARSIFLSVAVSTEAVQSSAGTRRCTVTCYSSLRAVLCVACLCVVCSIGTDQPSCRATSG